MSTADSNKDATPKAGPKVSGVGTVTVDGEVVYEPGQSWAAEVESAVKSAVDAVDGAVSSANEAAQGAAESVHARPVDPASSDSDYVAYVHYPKRGAIWLGVVLVILGALLLLDRSIVLFPELRSVFGDFSLWRFWPVLVIIGGIATAFFPGKDPANPRVWKPMTIGQFFDGMSLAVVGLVLLGCSLGFVSWFMWLAALSYWPILLVTGGLSILSGALRTDWFKALGSVIFMVTLLAVAASEWTAVVPLVEPFDTLAQLGSFRGFFTWR